MNIAIIHPIRQPPFAGPTRVYINLSKNRNVDLLSYDIHPKYLKYYSKYISENNFLFFPKKEELIYFLKRSNYDYIILDDFYKKLIFGINIRNKVKNINIAIYTQVYHGTSKNSVVDKGIRYIVSKLLNNFEILIANSRTGLGLLKTNYKIYSKILGYVYPSVDTEVFYPRYKYKEEESILIFLGNDFDTNKLLIEKILKTFINKKEIRNIYLLGNYELQRKLKTKFNSNKIIPLKGISDDTLAKIHSICSLTIVPQSWEPFGYVAAESIACNTPVLAFNGVGPGEIVKLTGLGLVANDEKEFLCLCKNYPNILQNIKTKKINTKKLPYNIENSYKKLIKLLGGYKNG